MIIMPMPSRFHAMAFRASLLASPLPMGSPAFASEEFVVSRQKDCKVLFETHAGLTKGTRLNVAREDADPIEIVIAGVNRKVGAVGWIEPRGDCPDLVGQTARVATAAEGPASATAASTASAMAASTTVASDGEGSRGETKADVSGAVAVPAPPPAAATPGPGAARVHLASSGGWRFFTIESEGEEFDLDGPLVRSAVSWTWPMSKRWSWGTALGVSGTWGKAGEEGKGYTSDTDLYLASLHISPYVVAERCGGERKLQCRLGFDASFGAGRAVTTIESDEIDLEVSLNQWTWHVGGGVALIYGISKSGSLVFGLETQTGRLIPTDKDKGDSVTSTYWDAEAGFQWTL